MRILGHLVGGALATVLTAFALTAPLYASAAPDTAFVGLHSGCLNAWHRRHGLSLTHTRLPLCSSARTGLRRKFPVCQVDVGKDDFDKLEKRYDAALAVFHFSLLLNEDPRLFAISAQNLK